MKNKLSVQISYVPTDKRPSSKFQVSIYYILHELRLSKCVNPDSYAIIFDMQSIKRIQNRRGPDESKSTTVVPDAQGTGIGNRESAEEPAKVILHLYQVIVSIVMTPAGQPPAASSAFSSYSGMTSAKAKALPSASIKNTSGQVSAHKPQPMHPSLSIQALFMSFAPFRRGSTEGRATARMAYYAACSFPMQGMDTLHVRFPQSIIFSRQEILRPRTS